jgi:hypothetical protein
MASDARSRDALVRRALLLAVITVTWNVAEGVIAVVESISAAVLIWRFRIERRDPAQAEQVERRALQLIGVAFLARAKRRVGAEMATGRSRPTATRRWPASTCPPWCSAALR